MPKIDNFELKVLDAYEKGKLKSVATKGELEKIREAARGRGWLSQSTVRICDPKRRDRFNDEKIAAMFVWSSKKYGCGTNGTYLSILG